MCKKRFAIKISQNYPKVEGGFRTDNGAVAVVTLGWKVTSK